MTDMGRMRQEPKAECATPMEDKGPIYPRLHDIDADKLPELKTTPIGSVVTLTIKAKLVGLEMHDQKNGLDSYWPANCADLEILAAKVDSTEKKSQLKSNNQEVDLGDLPSADNSEED